MKTQAEIDAFIKLHCVATTPVVDDEGGDPLLTRDDALFLLTSIVQDGGPMMSYLDVYSLGTDGELTFVDDLTEVDIHEMQQPEEEYKANLVKYLARTDAAALIAPTDFYLQKSVSQGRTLDQKDVEI
ncbi:hypothetical protein [Deinococcus sp.]|uniref:hypothetical protein n=1 Tax=Deinococcus sp. TaxID=47478 RepID=UPI0025DAD673|nr:hypothetical protein [Deinococcus sp.]